MALAVHVNGVGVPGRQHALVHVAVEGMRVKRGREPFLVALQQHHRPGPALDLRQLGLQRPRVPDPQLHVRVLAAQRLEDHRKEMAAGVEKKAQNLGRP